jgi:hypothetical protein
MGDCSWQLGREETDEAVGFLHVVRDFGEIAVGGYADGAAEGFSDVFVDGLLDVEGDLTGAGRLLFATEELADHLVY